MPHMWKWFFSLKILTNLWSKKHNSTLTGSLAVVENSQSIGTLRILIQNLGGSLRLVGPVRTTSLQINQPSATARHIFKCGVEEKARSLQPKWRLWWGDGENEVKTKSLWSETREECKQLINPLLGDKPTPRWQLAGPVGALGVWVVSKSRNPLKRSKGHEPRAKQSSEQSVQT